MVKFSFFFFLEIFTHWFIELLQSDYKTKWGKRKERNYQVRQTGRKIKEIILSFFHFFSKSDLISLYHCLLLMISLKYVVDLIFFSTLRNLGEFKAKEAVKLLTILIRFLPGSCCWENVLWVNFHSLSRVCFAWTESQEKMLFHTTKPQQWLILNWPGGGRETLTRGREDRTQFTF